MSCLTQPSQGQGAVDQRSTTTSHYLDPLPSLFGPVTHNLHTPTHALHSPAADQTADCPQTPVAQVPKSCLGQGKHQVRAWASLVFFMFKPMDQYEPCPSTPLYGAA